MPTLAEILAGPEETTTGTDLASIVASEREPAEPIGDPVANRQAVADGHLTGSSPATAMDGIQVIGDFEKQDPLFAESRKIGAVAVDNYLATLSPPERNAIPGSEHLDSDFPDFPGLEADQGPFTPRDAGVTPTLGGRPEGTIPTRLKELGLTREFFANIPEMVKETFKQQAGGIALSAGEQTSQSISWRDRLGKLAEAAAGPAGGVDEVSDILPKPIRVAKELGDWATDAIAQGFGVDSALVEGGQQLRDEALSRIAQLQPAEKTFMQEVITSGTQSAALALPGMAVSMITRNPTALLAAFGASTYGDSYGTARDAGKSPEEAHRFAMVDAGIEVGTEIGPAKIMLGASKTAIRQTLTRLFKSEMGGETLATIGQKVNSAMAGVDTMPLDQWMGELWEELKVTWATTAILTPLQGATAKLAGKAVDRLTGTDISGELETITPEETAAINEKANRAGKALKATVFTAAGVAETDLDLSDEQIQKFIDNPDLSDISETDLDAIIGDEANEEALISALVDRESGVEPVATPDIEVPAAGEQLDTQLSAAATVEEEQAIYDRRNEKLREIAVKDMTPAEKDQALLLNDLTHVPNRRKYAEDMREDPHDVQISVDLDGLKWANDTGGHQVGDMILGRMAKDAEFVVKGQDARNYHFSGDEFPMTARDTETAIDIITALQIRQEKSKISWKDKNNYEIELGITFGFGTDNEGNFGDADKRLIQAKEEAKALGHKSDRGEVPRSIRVRDSEGRNLSYEESVTYFEKERLKRETEAKSGKRLRDPIAEAVRNRLNPPAAIGGQAPEIKGDLSPLLEEAKQFDTSEDLLRSGGFSNENLSRAAFGFAEEDITSLHHSELTVKWHDDMLNPQEQIRVSGLSEEEWAKTVDLSEPIEVSYENGKFFIEDGHHRFTAARILDESLNVELEIRDNPVLALGYEGYDELHRDIFDKSQAAPAALEPFSPEQIESVPLREAIDSGLISEDEGAVIDGFLESLPESLRENFDVVFSGQEFEPTEAQLKAHDLEGAKGQVVRGALLERIKNEARDTIVMFGGSDVTTFFHEFGELSYKRLLTSDERKYVANLKTQAGSKAAPNEWFSDQLQSFMVQEKEEVFTPKLQKILSRIAETIKKIWEKIRISHRTPALDEIFRDILAGQREIEFGQVSDVIVVKPEEFRENHDWNEVIDIARNIIGNKQKVTTTQLNRFLAEARERGIPTKNMFVGIDSQTAKAGIEYLASINTGEIAERKTQAGPLEKSPHRYIYPKVRGGWTDAKIERELKKVSSFSTLSTLDKIYKKTALELKKFSSWQEMKENIFFHGTGSYVAKGLKAGFIQIRKGEEGGGGRGEEQRSISLSQGKNEASNFTGSEGFGTVYPVLLKKGAVVEDRPEIDDALDLEDEMVDLWERGVDAVKIGEWEGEFSEKEIVILNPRAILKFSGEGFRVFKKKRFENPTDKEYQNIFNQSVSAPPDLPVGEFIEIDQTIEAPASIGERQQPEGLRIAAENRRANEELLGIGRRDEATVSEFDALKASFTKAAQAARAAERAGDQQGVAKEKARMKAILESAKERKQAQERRTKALDQIKKELKTTKVKKQSGKPKGKFTADIQEIFNTLRADLKLNKVDAFNKIAKNLDDYKDSIPPFSIAIENRLLSVIAAQGDGIGRLEFARIQQQGIENLLTEIKGLKGVGKSAREAQVSDKVTEITDAREKVIDLVGGIPEGIEAVGEEGVALKGLAGIKQGIRNALIAGRTNSVVGWKDLLDIISFHDKTSKQGESAISQFGDVLDANNAEKQGNINAMSAFRGITFETYGLDSDSDMVKKFTQDAIIHDLGEFKTLNDVFIKLRMTRAEIRKRAMEIMDPTLHDTIFTPEGMGWTQEMSDAVFDFLTPQDEDFIAKQLEFYQKYYESINEVYKVIYGVNLPKNINYSPIAREGISQDAESTLGEFFNEISLRASADTAGGIKSRVATKLPLRPQSDISVIQQHVAEMEHFKAWSEKIRDLNAVFGDSDVRQAIRVNFGDKIDGEIQRFIIDMARGGTETSTRIATLDRMMGKYARSVLALKPSIFLKQLTSTIAYADSVPAAYWTKEVLKVHEIPKAVDMFFNEKTGSTLIKSRWDKGDIERDIANAMKSSEFARVRAKPSFLNAMMFNVKLGDMGAIIVGGYPVYKYHRSQGLSHEEALKRFESVTESTQQSADISQQSSWQRGGSFAKLFTMFMSSPNQYLRKEIGAIRNLAAGRMTATQFAKTMMIYHVILPMFFQLASDRFVWSGDEDEDALLPSISGEQKRAMILGSLNGFFIVGDALEAVISKALDLKVFGFENPMWSIVNDAMKAWPLLDWDDIDPEDFIIALRALAGATGAVTGLPLKQAVDFVSGFNETLSGEYETGIAQMMGWSPHQAQLAAERSEE